MEQREVFDIKKIVIAVTKADSSAENRSLTDSQIEDIAEFVEFKCNKLNRAVSVEENPGYGREPDHGDRSFRSGKEICAVPL